MTTSTETGRPWYPANELIDLDRQKVLMLQMERNINELEDSQFYHDFRNEVQSSPISKCIQRVLGSESKMQMIIYGIGNISKYLFPMLQLSLAILMKKDFIWIGEIKVFDPIISSTEIEVLETLGCSIFYFNEDGKRQARKPTMFFMPHCHTNLYNNLLEANWESNLLSNIIIFGNSFDLYIKDIPNFSRDLSSYDTKRKLGFIWRTMGHILAAQTFTNELQMKTISYNFSKIGLYESCFCDLSWHFFNYLTMERMRLIRENAMEEYGVSVTMGVKDEDLAANNPSDPKE